jgi:hypothetical protein
MSSPYEMRSPDDVPAKDVELSGIAMTATPATA